MKSILVWALFLGSSAFADVGLDEVRKSFEPLIQSSKIHFDRAEQMKVIPVGKGTPMYFDDCQQIKAKVRPNYKIDPFEFIYETGSTRAEICASTKTISVDSFVTLAGVSNFGLPYAFVIQNNEGRPSYGWNFTRNIFLDTNYRIVEIQVIGKWPDTGELLTYEIQSTDKAGNFYTSHWTKSYSVVGKDISGMMSMQKFLAADGSSSSPLVRRNIRHSTDVAKNYSVLFLSRADALDWQEYVVPFTYAWNGGYYNYDGKYYGAPKSFSHLTIKFRGEKEHCSNATTKAGDIWNSFPADKPAYYECLNY